MKQLTLTLFGLALILSALGQNNAQQEAQAGDFRFQMPAGWTRSDQGDKTFIQSPSATGTPATIFVLQGFDLGTTDLPTAFNAGWQSFIKGTGVRAAGGVVSQHSPQGFDYFAIPGAGDINGARWAVVFMGAQYGQRMETLVYLANQDPSQNPASAAVAQAFLNSIHFGPPAARPPAGQTNAGPPPVPVQQAAPPAAQVRSLERNPADPVWGPMSQNQMPSVPGKFFGIFRAPIREGSDPAGALELYDPSRNTPGYQYLILFPDGTAMRGLPVMGLDHFVASVRLDISGGGNSCAKWGVYRMQGNQGQVVFANPRAAGQQLVSGRFVGDAWAIQELADRLRINGNDYLLLDGGSPGMKLEGTFKPFGDRKQPGITFKADGQFIDEGILKTGGSTAIGLAGGGVAIGYAFSSPGPGPGMYRVSNYTLRLNYANSQAPNVLFWLGPGASRNNVRAIYLGNVRFERIP